MLLHLTATWFCLFFLQPGKQRGCQIPETCSQPPRTPVAWEGALSLVWVRCPPCSRGGWGWLHPNPGEWELLREDRFHAQKHMGPWSWVPQAKDMSRTQPISVHARNAPAPGIVLSCFSWNVGFVSYGNYDAASSSLPVLVGLLWACTLISAHGLRLCLCPHVGLPSWDMMFISPIFLNTCGSLRWWPDTHIGFIMCIPSIQSLPSGVGTALCSCFSIDPLPGWNTIPQVCSELVWSFLAPFGLPVSQPGLTRYQQGDDLFHSKNLPTLNMDQSLVNILTH